MDTNAPSKPTPTMNESQSSAERVQNRAPQESSMNMETVLIMAKQQIAESINEIAQHYGIPGVLLLYILQEIVYENQIASYRESFSTLNQNAAQSD